MKVRSRTVLLMLVMAVIAGCSACATGEIALKTQAATIDSLKLAGATGKLVAGPMDATCRLGLPRTVAVCDAWYLFVKGTDPKSPVCAAPTIGAVVTVHRSCGFKVSYKLIFDTYEAKKDLGVSAVSLVESIVQQMTGFADRAGGS